jgi:hypothetical protein
MTASDGAASDGPSPEACRAASLLSFESTVRIEAKVVGGEGSLPPEGGVVWSVTSSENPPHPWWLRGEGALNGLSWGEKAAGVGGHDWFDDEVLCTAPDGPVAFLTDAVGKRKVTVRGWPRREKRRFPEASRSLSGRGRSRLL